MKYKLVTACFLLIIVTLLLVKPFPSFGEGEEERISQQEEKYGDLEMSLGEAIALYHKSVNEMFNKRMERIVERGEKPEANLTASGDQAPCTPDSLRTYCLAMELADEFDGYARALLNRKQQVEKRELACSEADFQKVKEKIVSKLNEPDLDDAAKQEYQKRLEAWEGYRSKAISYNASQKIESKVKLIDRELDVSSVALDQAIAAYNEFLMAYPLHLKYQEMIKHLEKYRDLLGKIRAQVSEFPGRFVNATTTDCT